MKSPQDDTVRVSLDLDRPIYSRLVEAAKSDDRTVASLLRHLIRDRVERGDGAAA
jgi:predicted DNA-binding ribbon-helix-helix protein